MTEPDGKKLCNFAYCRLLENGSSILIQIKVFRGTKTSTLKNEKCLLVEKHLIQTMKITWSK